MQYKHLFFDLDHTLWDFEANCRLTLQELYHSMALQEKGVTDFGLFHQHYVYHNKRLWERYQNGFIKADELRWKRMWHSLLEFKIGNEWLAREMSQRFLDALPSRTLLFPHTHEILRYLTEKGYNLHLITNGFEKIQHSKLQHSGLTGYFREVITSEGSNSQKPQKEIFEYALKRASADKSESIMLGDNVEADIQGAINAGIDQVYINHLKEEPVVRPTYMVYSLRELETIF